MGVNLRDLITGEKITFKDLRGKVIAIDSLNVLYQFLTSIRRADGTPLMDSEGRTTSHLSGLFYRTSNIIKSGIKPVYVFDGKPPELKIKTLEQRKKAKAEAEGLWAKAKAEGRMEDAQRYAKRTSRFTGEMLEASKILLEKMGVPYMVAPSEGEAQCAYMCKKGDVFASGSQDYDTLLCGSSRLVKNLTMSGYGELEVLYLDKTLENLGITREQLVEMGILIGTDFNEGIKGVGPKNALKIIRKGKIGEIKKEIENFDEIKNLFLNPATSDDYELKWNEPSRGELLEFLCEEHDFSKNRIENTINDLEKSFKELSQRDLSAWF